MSSTSRTCDTLLRVDEGETLDITARTYDYKTPMEVVDIDEVSWERPDGSVWRSRSVVVSSNESSGRSARREYTAVQGAGPPEDEKYGPLVDVSRVERDAGDSDGEQPEWLARHAPEIVAGSSIDTTLADVLDECERQETLLDVHQRLRSQSLNVTKDLLWELGLRAQNGRLLDDALLEVRIATLREVYVDE